jgi:hypothetical protein
MKKMVFIIALLSFFNIICISAQTISSASNKTSFYPVSGSACTKSACGARQAMRFLWKDQAIYTRNYIISSLANLEDTEAVTQRLLQNQVDIGNGIKPYYGEDAGNKLTELLKQHVMITLQAVNATKTGNSKDLTEAQKSWKQNINDLASFLSGINPNWNKKNLTAILEKYLQLTSGEILSRLNKDWNSDLSMFNKAEEQIIMLSDYISDGIIKQFPEKFIQ